MARQRFQPGPRRRSFYSILRYGIENPDHLQKGLTKQALTGLTWNLPVVVEQLRAALLTPENGRFFFGLVLSYFNQSTIQTDVRTDGFEKRA